MIWRLPVHQRSLHCLVAFFILRRTTADGLHEAFTGDMWFQGSVLFCVPAAVRGAETAPAGTSSAVAVQGADSLARGMMDPTSPESASFYVVSHIDITLDLQIMQRWKVFAYKWRVYYASSVTAVLFCSFLVRFSFSMSDVWLLDVWDSACLLRFNCLRSQQVVSQLTNTRTPSLLV